MKSEMLVGKASKSYLPRLHRQASGRAASGLHSLSLLLRLVRNLVGFLLSSAFLHASQCHTSQHIQKGNLSIWEQETKDSSTHIQFETEHGDNDLEEVWEVHSFLKFFGHDTPRENGKRSLLKIEHSLATILD